jgi:hypothetical protein
MTDDQVRPGAQADVEALADEIMKALDDQVPPRSPSWWQYQLVAGELGADVMRQLVTEVRAVEAKGGMKTLDGSRQRSAGGIFFVLVGEKIGRRQMGSIRRKADRLAGDDKPAAEKAPGTPAPAKAPPAGAAAAAPATAAAPAAKKPRAAKPEPVVEVFVRRRGT